MTSLSLIGTNVGYFWREPFLLIDFLLSGSCERDHRELYKSTVLFVDFNRKVDNLKQKYFSSERTCSIIDWSEICDDTNNFKTTALNFLYLYKLYFPKY